VVACGEVGDDCEPEAPGIVDELSGGVVIVTDGVVSQSQNTRTSKSSQIPLSWRTLRQKKPSRESQVRFWPAFFQLTWSLFRRHSIDNGSRQKV